MKWKRCSGNPASCRVNNEEEAVTSDPLPEIKENEAEGATADLYDDIRAVIRVPMVNLVFRHMATVPGCLSWAWATIRPLYINHAIPDAAANLTSEVMPGYAVDLTKPAALSNLTLLDVIAIEQVLDAYGRANPMNLIGLKIIDLALDKAPQAPGTGNAPPLSMQALMKPDGLTNLLPMTDPATASEQISTALNRLARQIHGGDTGVIPSLYRHFGKWPDFLNALEAQLNPIFSGDVFEHTAHIMQTTGEGVASELYATLPLPEMDQPDQATATALKRLIRQFPPNICRMTVLATLLRRGLSMIKV
jgi:hypothetical protein